MLAYGGSRTSQAGLSDRWKISLYKLYKLYKEVCDGGDAAISSGSESWDAGAGATQ